VFLVETSAAPLASLVADLVMVAHPSVVATAAVHPLALAFVVATARAHPLAPVSVVAHPSVALLSVVDTAAALPSEVVPLMVLTDHK